MRKTQTKKKRLIKADRLNRGRVPVFVTIRTKRKVVQGSRRNWRTEKLRTPNEE